MTLLRELNLISILFRLVIAMLFGGLIGMERGRKHRAAGMRTYMLVCMGASLTVLLSQYEYMMLETAWSSAIALSGSKTDVSRFGAQVINGVGFLGAGTILVTARQEVKGLTTAAGLWASACVGLAIGAGFYEAVLMAFLVMLLVMNILPTVEGYIVDSGVNMNIYVEFLSLEAMGAMLSAVKNSGAKIYSVDIERQGANSNGRPSAVLSIRLKERRSHAQVLANIAKLDGIAVVDEI